VSIKEHLKDNEGSLFVLIKEFIVKRLIGQGENELVIHQDVGRLRGTLTNIQRRGMNSLLKRAYDQFLQNKQKKEFSISTDQLLKDMHISYTMGKHSKIKLVHDPLKDLMKKSFVWGTAKQLREAVFIQEISISDEEVTFIFSDYIREKLAIISNALIVKNFTLLQSFKSNYAGQLYKHIESWKDREEMILSVGDFKAFLGVPKTESYERMEYLRRKVVNVAIKEINEKTDLKLKVELLKRDSDKRKITHFKFTWGTGKKPIVIETQPDNPIYAFFPFEFITSDGDIVKINEMSYPAYKNEVDLKMADRVIQKFRFSSTKKQQAFEKFMNEQKTQNTLF